MYSLKRLVWLAFLVVSILLGSVVVLGAYQFRLAGGYNKVISQNESVLFRFMTLRESITETLITADWQGLAKVNSEIEQLNSELSRLKNNKLVSAELQLALVNKVDLKGLAILLRQVVSDHKRGERSQQLQQQLRAIADFLLHYDRIIVSQAREQIVSFQRVVIGALGLIISLTSISLLLLHRNTVSPLLYLLARMQSETFDPGDMSLGRSVVKEVADLGGAIEQHICDARQSASQTESDRNVEALLAETVNETTNHLNGIINYAQLLYDSKEQLNLPEEQLEMLQKIIDSGVYIAGEWQGIK